MQWGKLERSGQCCSSRAARVRHQGAARWSKGQRSISAEKLEQRPSTIDGEHIDACLYRVSSTAKPAFLSKAPSSAGVPCCGAGSLPSRAGCSATPAARPSEQSAVASMHVTAVLYQKRTKLFVKWPSCRALSSCLQKELQKSRSNSHEGAAKSHRDGGLADPRRPPCIDRGWS